MESEKIGEEYDLLKGRKRERSEDRKRERVKDRKRER
jgi:hypothetical protein